MFNQHGALENDNLSLVALHPDEHLLPGAVSGDDYLVIGEPSRPAAAGGYTVPALSPVAVLFAVCFLVVGFLIGPSALYPSNLNLVPFDRNGLPLFDCPL
jgi:hypothetical protein